MGQLLFVLIALAALLAFLIIRGLRVVQQYERGVLFILGRLAGAKGPGLIWIPPFISRLITVDLRLVRLNVPSQEAITRDNVTLSVTAVLYFSIVDPVAAVVQVRDAREATTQMGQAILRDVIGQADLDAS